jgi:ribosome biogenesis GTPase
VRVERTQSVVVGADGLDSVVTSLETPAVGDWVTIDGGRIIDVLPRTSALARMDPDKVSVQVLASNIDLVAITVPADRPNAARVERELAVAWGSGAEPVVIMTKGDLAPEMLFTSLRTRLVGVDVLFTSAKSGEGIDDVRQLLKPHRTAVLLGPSGAGKSTLANALVGEDRLATGEVRGTDNRGRHTTTSRQLVVVPTGGTIIDTPGLRGLGLVGDSIERVFPDIYELIATCRFDDCAHEAEPGCGVVAALRSGRLDRDRLESFRKLSQLTRPQNRSQSKSTPKSRSGSNGHGIRRHERPPEIEDEDDIDL